MDSGELTIRCRRLLDAGLPDHIPARLADEHDALPLGLDIESDVAVVAVLRWWFGPPGRLQDAPDLRSGAPSR